LVLRVYISYFFPKNHQTKWVVSKMVTAFFLLHQALLLNFQNRPGGHVYSEGHAYLVLRVFSHIRMHCHGTTKTCFKPKDSFRKSENKSEFIFKVVALFITAFFPKTRKVVPWQCTLIQHKYIYTSTALHLTIILCIMQLFA